MSEDDGLWTLDSVFTEPPRPPSPLASTAIYTREVLPSTSTDWTQISVRLVGSHPLWGHYLWNSARAFATYLDQNPHLYKDRFVLELGAGGGLPGIVTAINGARKVVLTDYPDPELLENLRHNVQVNVSDTQRRIVDVEGYIWGRRVAPLLSCLPNSQGFDLIILSDLVFNHGQHEALLMTCEQVLAPSTSTQNGDNATPPCVLVFYSHHRPWLASKDAAIFHLAEQRGWKCEKILERKYTPMFPEDGGDEEIRSTVHGWRLTRPNNLSG